MKNVFYKKAIAYRLIEPVSHLLQGLNEKPVAEPRDKETMTEGFAHAFEGSDDPDFAFVVSPGLHCVRLVTIKKEAKPAAIAREVAKRVAVIADTDGRKVSRKERADIKDDVAFSANCAALPVETSTRAFIDENNMMLVVEAGSFKAAENMLNHLREALGTLKVETLTTSRIPGDVYQQWVEDNSQPPALRLDGYAKFSNPHNLAHTATLKHCELTGAAVAGIVSEGLRAEELALVLTLPRQEGGDETHDAPEFDFTIDEELKMKSISFPGTASEAYEQEEDAELIYRASMTINCATITDILAIMVEQLGGLVKN